MSRREQVIAVGAGAIVLFYALYNWGGLSETLSRLGTERRSVARLAEDCEEYRQSMANFPQLLARYERYANYSLLDAEGDLADVFSNYANGILTQINLPRPPRIQPAEYEEIEDIDDYVQILLPIEFDAEFDDLNTVLTTFDQQRLLIRSLEVNSTGHDSEMLLRVKLTLSRFVRIEETDEGEDTRGGRR